MKKLISVLGMFALVLTAATAYADNSVDETMDDSSAVISSVTKRSVDNTAHVNVDNQNKFNGTLRANVSSNSGLNAFISGGDIEDTTNETSDADASFDSSTLANSASSDVWVEQEACACEGETSEHNSISGTSDDSEAIVETTLDENRHNNLDLNGTNSNEANDDSEVSLASNTGGNLFDAKNDIEGVQSRTGAPSASGSLSREFNKVTALFTVKQR